MLNGDDEEKVPNVRNISAPGADHGPTSEVFEGDHEWIVSCTALRDICLMVQCLNCGAQGTVDKPSAEEWARAFTAQSRPYRWVDNSGVNVRESEFQQIVDTEELRGEISQAGHPEGAVA